MHLHVHNFLSVIHHLWLKALSAPAVLLYLCGVGLLRLLLFVGISGNVPVRGRVTEASICEFEYEKLRKTFLYAHYTDVT